MWWDVSAIWLQGEYVMGYLPWSASTTLAIAYTSIVRSQLSAAIYEYKMVCDGISAIYEYKIVCDGISAIYKYKVVCDGMLAIYKYKEVCDGVVIYVYKIVCNEMSKIYNYKIVCDGMSDRLRCTRCMWWYKSIIFD